MSQMENESSLGGSSPRTEFRATPRWAVAGAWLLVSTPLAYGLWETILKAVRLFEG